MNFTLKPTEDFVLERKEFWRNKSMTENGSEMYCRSQHSKECEKYSEFVKKELKREMFVLCDSSDKPLPFTIGGKGTLIYGVGSQHIEEARKRLLFKVEREGEDFFLNGHNVEAILQLNKHIKDLMWTEPVLTDNAKKEIGL